MSRIIRDFAGVTSRSTKRAGFAYAHTAPYRSCSFACNGNSAFSFRKQSLFQRKVLQPQLTHAKSGFTLAEVLITLGIIGIVAAMTIPMFVNKYKEKARITNLKKIYSQLQNAYNLAVYENGPVKNWDLSITYNKVDDENYTLDNEGRNKFMAYITKYLKKAGDVTINYDGSYSLDGRQYGEASSVAGNASSLNDDKGSFLTADGFYIIMGWINEGNVSDIWVTLPNEKKIITGVNRFHFNITEKGFVPDGGSQGSFSTYCNVKNKSIASNLNGRTCTAWALQYENMEYLRCNDLKFGQKTKCK